MKGLYARSVARIAAEEEDLLTSVDQEYEAPSDPELILDGGREERVEELARRVWDHIRLGST